MAGRGVAVAERAVRVSQTLMDGRDAREIADLLRPFERAAVVGAGRGGLPQVLRAAAERDQDAQAEQLVGRACGLGLPQERREQLPRAARVAGDPGRDGELVVGRARQPLVPELCREALRDGECGDGLRSAMEEVQRRSRRKSQAADLADAVALGVQHALRAAQRLGSAGEGEETGDRGKLELALRADALAFGVIEEVRRRLPELPRHVLE